MTFQREDRYIVIKRSDLKKVPVAYRRHLVDPMFSLLGHLPRRECAVIESDWPEFEPVWRMIEARVTGVVPEVMRWPLKGVLPGVEGISKAVLKPVVVLASDYDALAAQHDEGLAREADLRKALRIAETYVQTAFARAQQKDKLGRKLPADHPISADLSRVLAALASPGCADEEKAQ